MPVPSLPRRVNEVSTLEELDRLVAAGARSLAGWRLRDLDLRSRGPVLRTLDPAQALFLGCRLDAATEADLEQRGALVFPVVPDVPVDPYRARLYAPEELYDGLADEPPGAPYEETLDARAFAWAGQTRGDLRASLTRGLHDLAVDTALEEATRDQPVVGVMGGHDLARGSTGYRDAARLGRALRRAGLVVATGGGPGAMEAANLGAYLAGADDAALDEALGMLSVVPGYAGRVGEWARCAFEVRRRWPPGPGLGSLGVPTWFYGHEPPNVFPDRVAKYFRNAIREDVLLHVCTAGTVFLPGQAGTVQELFQDACENFYAEAPSVAPMVLVGVRFWTEELPCWPLLKALAAGREMAGLVHVVDDLHAVPALLQRPDATLQR